ncbi:PREDICTED: zinc finger protein GIS2-like [Tarenaya hassleriana]|uniref:zinc finger protein GIS2-like n=1 Tax=Tarenaya hassleriana TaxID=28532 RepID=UPI0008FCEB6E|nr:PREDICTED: zinc finger protein GIS2-like [Tarenaya hassleriana]
MSLDSRSKRSPVGRKICSDRFSYRDARYRRDSRRSFSQSNLCNNCKRPGHFARECHNVSICHNCGLPGHILSECSTKSLCWNCREPGHMASNCPNKGICHTCGKAGHQAKDCTSTQLQPGTLDYATTAKSKGTLQRTAQMKRPATTAGKQGIWLVIVQTTLCATCVMWAVMWLGSALKLARWETEEAIAVTETNGILFAGTVGRRVIRAGTALLW